VRRLEAFGRPPAAAAAAGEAAGFTLEEQIYITRGEIAARAGEPRPAVTTRLRVGLFWLGREPLVRGRDYLLKLATQRVTMRVDVIHRALDLASFAARSPADVVARLEAADCTLVLDRAIAADTAEIATPTARFVIVDGTEIAGGGLVREALTDAERPVRDKVLLRNAKWETSFIPVDRRAERYRQHPTLLLLTGPREVERKHLAKALEAQLFEAGHVVYYLGMANVVYGVDADLGRAADDRAEHMRRLAEIANLLLDAGVILLVTAQELTRRDLDLIRTAAPADRVVTAWLGDRLSTDLPLDLALGESAPEAENVERLRALLEERGAFRAGGLAHDVP
jgi:bifunctional enzyme CysN/CysC